MGRSTPPSLSDRFRHERLRDKAVLAFEKARSWISKEEPPAACRHGFLVYEGGREDEHEHAPEAA